MPPQPAPPAPTVRPASHAELIDRNVAQANIVMGFGGIARSNPDYYKLQVMNYILGGGGFTSRLMQVVRSKAGPGLLDRQRISGGQIPRRVLDRAADQEHERQRSHQAHPCTDCA